MRAVNQRNKKYLEGFTIETGAGKKPAKVKDFEKYLVEVK